MSAEGVLWSDGGSLQFREPDGRLKPLRVPASPSARIASSAGRVAVPSNGLGEAFLAGRPAGPLRSIGQPGRVAGGGCRAWQVQDEFVLAGPELIAGGECEYADRQARRPLFATEVSTSRHQPPSGGTRWHVLRWLRDKELPLLAAEGGLLAAEVPAADRRMQVSILDARTGRSLEVFGAPAGVVTFASRDRLVLSVPQPPGGGPRFSLGEIQYNRSWTFTNALYTLKGRRLAELGTSRGLPVASAMHLVAVREGSADGEGELTVRSLAHDSPSPPRPLLGFTEPALSLAAEALRWPVLAVAETIRAPLRPAELTCWSQPWGQARTSLRILDLDREEPFRPAPPVAYPQLPSSPSCEDTVAP